MLSKYTNNEIFFFSSARKRNRRAASTENEEDNAGPTEAKKSENGNEVTSTRPRRAARK